MTSLYWIGALAIRKCNANLHHWRTWTPRVLSLSEISQPSLGTRTWIINRPISQIPECICAISHNATFCNRNVHTCAHFCYKMVHCGIYVWCIVGFVRWVYCTHLKQWMQFTHQCHNSNGGLIKRLKLWHGWIITSHIKTDVNICHNRGKSI